MTLVLVALKTTTTGFVLTWNVLPFTFI